MSPPAASPHLSDLPATLSSLTALLHSLASSDPTTSPPPPLAMLTAHLSTLKRVNRASSVKTRECKARALQLVHDTDAEHLEMQRLLYERRHLEQEIARCKEFDSIYTSVPLQPLDEFRASNAGAPEADAHELMLARLRFELSERQRLDARRKALQAEKAALAQANKGTKADLEEIDALLEDYVKAAYPIKDRLMQMKNNWDAEARRHREGEGGAEKKEGSAAPVADGTKMDESGDTKMEEAS